jgi:CSLREA domain-containing protein
MSRRRSLLFTVVAVIASLVMPAAVTAVDAPVSPPDASISAARAADTTSLFGVTLDLPAEVAAFDGRVLVKTGAAEVIGVALSGKGTALRPELAGGAFAVGAYGLEPVDGAVRLDLAIAATAAGRLQVRVVLDSVADRDGNPVALRTRSLLTTVEVDGGKALLKAPDAKDRQKADRAPGKTKDVYRDGKFDQRDVDATRNAWISSRAADEPCRANAATDANADGCIDAMDLQALVARDGDKAAAKSGRFVLASTRESGSPDTTLAAPLRTFVVTSALDTADATPGNGVCADSLGRCTLRAAITEADWLAGEDAINFNIAGAAPVRIQIGSRLPLITSRSGGVTIDGYSQPGSVKNTATFGSNAIPGIEIRGNGQAAREMGLFITSPNNVVQGLLFGNLWRGVFLDGPNATANKVVGNWVGYTALQGASGGQYGVVFNNGAHHNIVGTPALADRNVIGNWGAGIDAYGPGSDFNIVQNNLFCIRPDGNGTASCSSAIDHNFGPKNGLFGGLDANERNIIGRTSLQCIEYSHGYNPSGPPGTDFSITYQINNNRVLGNWAGFRHNGAYDPAYRCGQNSSTADNAQGINVYDGANDNLVEGNFVASVFDGIQTMAPTAQRNIIRNNVIGESPFGVAAPLNRWGVIVRWSSTLSVVEGNTIKNAAAGGIGLLNVNNRNEPMGVAYNIRLSRNIVTNTNGPAIDLFPGAGPNANDPGDDDDGANTLLNTPVLTSVTTSRVEGTAQAGSVVEVYEASRPAGQFGLPIAFLGQATAAGNGTWSLPVALDVGDRVTALQIRPDLNTSELSVNVAATAGVPNTPPVVDSVTIGPANPTTNQTLTATVTSHDANGDPLTTAYQWTRNGTDIAGATGSTLNLGTAGNGDKGDLIRVRVTVNDGATTSAPVTSSPVTVANTAPTATVSLAPSSPQTDATMTATATKADVDGDAVGLTFVWTVNGVERRTFSSPSALTDTFDLAIAGNGDSGDTVSVAVTANDGTANGTAATASVTVAGGPTIYAIDTFSRTLSNTWGSANTGGAYTLSGTVGDFDVNGSAGTMAMAAGANRAAILAGASATDVDLSFRVSTDKVATGTHQYVYGLARRINATTEYRAKVRFGTNGGVYLHAGAVVNNVETAIGSEIQVPGLTQTANTFIWVRTQVSGTNPTTIRIRAWADGSPEPTTWTYTGTNSAASLQAAGGVGLRVYLGGATTNAPVLFRFDDLRATSIVP